MTRIELGKSKIEKPRIRRRSPSGHDWSSINGPGARMQGTRRRCRRGYTPSVLHTRSSDMTRGDLAPPSPCVRISKRDVLYCAALNLDACCLPARVVLHARWMEVVSQTRAELTPSFLREVQFFDTALSLRDHSFSIHDPD